jgi:hypothetical protein
MISGWYCEKRVCNGTGSPLRLLFIIESAYCGGMQYFLFSQGFEIHSCLMRTNRSSPRLSYVGFRRGLFVLTSIKKR